MAKLEITRADIMAMDEYATVRDARRKVTAELKRHRRVAVGRDVTFYFENFETMWMQIHEMLRIEGGGEAQIDDELAAYNPLIPNGRELIATMMIEIDDEARRARVLAGLGGIEDTISLSLAGDTVAAVSETEVERTTEAGKTSSIHFLHFPFTDTQTATFRDPETQAVLAIAHPNYGHMAVLPADVKQALAADFDPLGAGGTRPCA